MCKSSAPIHTPPEHGEPSPSAPAPSEGERAESTEAQLISEPSACPFCVQPEFGVTYAPPPFRRGLAYMADPSARPSPNITSPVSSTTSLSSENVAPIPGRRRATSLSASDPAVVTTDKVRPDWAQKLANARAHAARRSAAATALHAAAYLINSGSSGTDSRGLGLGRRGLRRATQGDSGRTGSPALNALAFLTERPDRTSSRVAGPDTDSTEGGASNLAPPRDSSRRSRIDDLEEMMMMEAIRLSLASEEERRRKEEKEAKKEAKRREKEAKKADKVARKTGMYSNNASTSALDVPVAECSLVQVASGASALGNEGIGKGKGVDRAPPSAILDSSLPSPSDGVTGAKSAFVTTTSPPAISEPPRPSHLRNMSSASSFSSIMENTPDERTGSHVTTDGSNTSLEPMFNFRSLAEVIGDEEKGNESEHVEDAQHNTGGSSSATPSVHQAVDSAHPELMPVASPPIDIHGHGPSGMLPKELETRSVEITSPAANPETTS